MEVGSKSFFNLENSLKISFPLLVLLGVVNLTSYYSQFGLPILDYLSLTEIIPLFLGNIIYFVLVVIPVFFLSGTSNLENSRAAEITVLFISIVVGFLILLNDDGVFDFRNKVLVISLLVVYLPFVLVIVLEKYFVIHTFINQIPRFVLILFFYLTALLATSIIAWTNAKEVKKIHKFSGTQIFVEGKPIISNDTIYFIGKSDRYIFLYNERDLNPIIIPLSKVEKITFVNKHLTVGFDRPPNLPPVP